MTELKIPTEHDHADLGRATTISRIRQGLQRRTGRRWSVSGGRGTAYGWIRVTVWGRGAHPMMTDEERGALGEALGLPPVHFQGYSNPDSSDYYREAVDRAEGRVPCVDAEPYWD